MYPDPPPGADQREAHRGHMRMALRFAHTYQGQFVYVHGVGWHQWDQHRWAECLDGAPYRALESMLVRAYEELPKLDSDSRVALFRDIQKSESAEGARGTLGLAGNFHPCTVAGNRMDDAPMLFNTTGGTLDLSSGTVREPDPYDYISMLADAKFDPDARSVLFDGFLTTILPDEHVRAFVQRLVGYSLLGRVREHVMPIWTGTGANGKGTLRDAIAAAFGDYAINVDPEILMASPHPRHATYLLDLKGKRIAFCSETEKGRRFAEATMRRLVGGDPIRANRMRQDTIEFQPSHTLIMMTNHLPIVSGDDPATWRRILVVPFDVEIPKESQDPELPEKLSTPDVRAAVLAWAWRGWLDYQLIGLSPPEAVRVRTEAYQRDSDTVGRFLAEECETGPGHSVASQILYARFGTWCRQNGEEIMSKTMFGKAMRERGFGSEKNTTTRAMTYRGLGVIIRDEEPDRWR